MPETKYVARRAGLFASLMQATELAGFRLEPLGPVSLRDVYFDTPSGDLLRQGYSLRVREQGAAAQAQLRALRAPAGARAREADAALEAPTAADVLPDLPAGALREMLELLAGDQQLRALLRLRQDRSPRVLYDGRRLVGVISLDVVGYELPTRIHVANEIEIELAGTGRETDLSRMDPVLRAAGLEATNRSKFERGVLGLQGEDGVALLLLPDERRSLERMLEAPEPGLRRRARVVLMASRGLSENVVSARAGLSTARVRHWVDRFRTGRLTALREPDVQRTGFAPAQPAAPPPSFRVSEIVSHGVPTAAVFRPEHFDPETDSGFIVERSREAGAPADPRGDGAAGDGAAGPPPRGVPAPEWFEGPPLTVIPVEPADAAADEDPFGREAPAGDAGLSADAPAVLADATELAASDVTGAGAASGLEAPPDAPVPDAAHEQGGAAPEIASSSRARVAKRPRLDSETPILHAAAEVLGYQVACLDAASEALLETGEPAAARKALLAAHRVRLALETFEEFLPERPVERLHERLRGVARALDTLVDHDAALAVIARQSEDAEAPSARTRLEDRRAAALLRARTRLTAARHVQWRRRMERLLALLQARRAAGDLEANFFRQPPDDYLDVDEARPNRLRLRHLVASTMWRRYEEIRAYERLVSTADEARLRPLAVRSAALAFVLGLASDAAPGEARSASRALGALESALGDLRRRAVTRALLEENARPATGGGDPLAVSEAWAAVAGEAFRASLAAVAAAV